ncbi:MAG: hypothetical protein H7067_07115 [Burkholderiales bacterium]|nr:hypothetical protein [Opitutaceae bacterium]
MPRTICETRILRRDEDQTAGFEASQPDVNRHDPDYIPKADSEWHDAKPAPRVSDTITPVKSKSYVVSCEMTWTDLRIDIRTNLIDRVAETIQTILDAGLGVVTNENTLLDAIRTIAAKLRLLFDSSRREIVQSWSLGFTSEQASPYVFATHNQTTTTSVHRLGQGGSTMDMSVRAESELRLDTVLVPKLNLVSAGNLGQTKERDKTQECSAVALRGTTHSIRGDYRLILDFVGFKATIEELITDLTQVIHGIVAGGISAARVWEFIKELRAADNPIDEIDRKLEKLREELEKGLKEMLGRLIKILREYTGHVIIHSGAVRLFAIQEETYIRIDDAVHGPQNSDGPQDGPPPSEPPQEDPPAAPSAPPSSVPGSFTAPLSILARSPKFGPDSEWLIENELYPTRSLVITKLPAYRALLDKKQPPARKDPRH